MQGFCQQLPQFQGLVPKRGKPGGLEMEFISRVQCLDNAVYFLQNPHNRQPRVKTLLYILPQSLKWCMQYHVITYNGPRARINSWIELELIINSIQFNSAWIELELNWKILNWNWKPELIGIDQFNQFIFISTPHFTWLSTFYMPYYGNCSVTSNPM